MFSMGVDSLHRTLVGTDSAHRITFSGGEPMPVLAASFARATELPACEIIIATTTGHTGLRNKLHLNAEYVLSNDKTRRLTCKNLE